MASYANLAKKLQRAINQRAGAKLLINTSQWYSIDKQRPVTVYVIKLTMPVPNKPDKIQNVEMFKTYSQVQMVLWLRDYWYELNGWEVPTDNEIWEGMKNNYGNTERTGNTDSTY